MSGDENNGRAAALVVDERGLALVDLGTGEIRAADPSSVIVGSPPVPDSGARLPTPIVPRPTATSPSAHDLVRLVGPSALLVRSGRVFAWSSPGAGYVELSASHLEVLNRLRTGCTVGDLAAVNDSAPEAVAVLGQLNLVAIEVVEHDEFGSPDDDEPRNEDSETEQPESDQARHDEPAPIAHTSVEPVTVAEETDPPRPASMQPARGSAPRLPSVFVDLPADPLSKLHVVAYRLVGRARRGALRRVGRRDPVAQPDPDLAPPVGAARAGEPDVAFEPVTLEPITSEPDAITPDPVEPLTCAETSSEPVATGPAVRDDRIPVIPLYRWGSVSDDQGYSAMVEPSLSVGMIFAAARQHDGGALERVYDLRRMRPDAEEVFLEWAADPRPAIFAFSDYLWNIDEHLEFSRRVKEVQPDAICIHGGPSVPKFEEDAVRFFADHPSVDVAVRGEGEVTFVEILRRLDGNFGPDALDRLAGIEGLTYRRSDSGEPVRSADRPRVADLDSLPSPYLTGEFDDLLGVDWRSASVESNRGCPYGCTYCDWGSATLARIRKFDLDRVRAELDWIMEHAGPAELHVADANFGVFARDVEIAQHVADLKERLGAPHALTISLAKNTVKYSQSIIAILVGAGVSPITASSAVQTLDEHTLKIVRRHNIKVEKYDELAVTFAEQGIPLVTDLLMGLPGATVTSFRNDLQHCFDREVTPRTMEIIMLPNSPMNEPSYREEHEIVVDENGVIVGASSYTRADYETMKRLRLIFRAFDHFGLLRHLLRVLQWDYDIPAVDLMADVDAAVTADPSRYPLLSFVARAFDVYTIPPVDWTPFYDEVVQFLSDTRGVELTSDLATVIELQRALMPTRGRDYPIEVPLEHDYVEYYAHRAASQRDGLPHRELTTFPPSSLRVADPGDITSRYIKRNDFPGRRSATTGNLFWVGFDWELDSPLVRHLATNVGRFDAAEV